MSKLLIATKNVGKIREYREIFQGLPTTTLAEEGIRFEAEEKGQSFRENARVKALTYSRATGLVALADDSGLEVDALEGAPGVRSSRYAGPDATDEDRYMLLLKNLEGVPWERRGARFRCAIAIADTEGNLHVVEGLCEGTISLEPRGTSGFGFDPVFYVPEYGKTMAELPLEVKNQISHRARAVRQAFDVLKKFFPTLR